MNRLLIAATLLTTLSLTPAAAAEKEVRLNSLDLGRMRQGYGTPMIDSSIRGTSLTIAGRSFAHGVGTHAVSTLWVDLKGGTERFRSWVGLDDSADGKGSVAFEAYADGKKVWTSGPMKPGTPAVQLDLPLAGAKTLLLRVDTTDDGQEFDHADWAEASFTVSGEPPVAGGPPPEERVILKPKPGPAPRINGGKVYGCRPGHPFLYRIPATGTRPMKFSAAQLPEGLKLDAAAGILTGTAPPRGEYAVTLHAANDAGKDSRALKIVSGDKLSLTPYMGWNHWYAHYMRITDPMIREAADLMISNGMADAGYDYVCIDDCWARMPEPNHPDLGGQLRDTDGNILPNARFPDMKALTDTIHSKGMKAGIYTSPGIRTCTQYAGSLGHEAQDAKRFADWGFDLLKYDWCSYGEVAPQPDLAAMKKPYELMGKLIAGQKRDIVFNLCQYGMGDVWTWGAEVHGNSWRTSGDLGFELDRFIQVARKNSGYRQWNRPGEWNDPDYLQIGYVGNAHTTGEPAPSSLTPSEQHSFMSLWCLMAAPLIYGGDLARLDEFTLSILCNPEAIEVNQDPLGQCGALTDLGDGRFLLVKDMEDGSKAVGLCNGGETEATIEASWSALGVKGRQRVRDLWRHKDLGTFENKFTATAPRHATVFVRLFPE